MRKKTMFTVCITVLSLCLFTGCGGTSSGDKKEAETGKTGKTVEDNGKVELSVWSEESHFELLNQMFESFKKEYSGQADFEITCVEHSDAQTKSEALGDIQNAPDIFPMADDQLSAMVAGGALYPVPDADRIRSANVKESVDAASINGTLYAYPYSADNGYFLYYNKDYFSESDVQNLDTILKICRKNKKKFTMPWDSGWYNYTFWGNTGLEFGINEDGVTNHCNWNTTEGEIKGIDVAGAMNEIAGNSGFLALPNDQLIDKIKDGTVIAAVSGIWHAVDIQGVWSDYGAAKLPTYTVAGKQVQLSSFTGYKMYGVNYYSKHREWACKLADWISNEENQTLRFQVKNQGPSNTKAADSEEVKKVPAIQAVLAQSEFGTLQRVGNNFWGPTAEFGVAMAEGKGKLSNQELQKLLDKMVKGVTASVAD